MTLYVIRGKCWDNKYNAKLHIACFGVLHQSTDVPDICLWLQESKRV